MTGSHINDNLTKRLVELAGETLADRFVLKKLVGQGGYGAVYLAEQLSMGRRCAVKVLVPQVIESQHNVHRFRREARATSQLEHPNTIVIYDFGVDEKRQLLYIAMEYVEGMSLRDRIAEDGQLALHDTVWIAHQAAGSLHDAHNLGLVHRDIKPHNIMLTTRAGDSNFAKVIDFGIAKFLDHASIRETLQQVTSTGLVIGTPAYMAPEQVRSLDLDGRADQYALAACVYQMLTGRLMFTGHSAIDIASKQLTQDVPSMRKHNPAIPKEVDAVVRRALSKRREDRFDDILDFTQALAAAAGVVLPGETTERPALPPEETLLQVAAPTTALSEPVAATTEPDAFAETVATDEEADPFLGNDTIAVPISAFDDPAEPPDDEPPGADTVAVSIDDVLPPPAIEPRVFVAGFATGEVRRTGEETLGDVQLQAKDEPRSRAGIWVALLFVIALVVAAAFAISVIGGDEEADGVANANEVPALVGATEPGEDESVASSDALPVDILVEATDAPNEPEKPNAKASPAPKHKLREGNKSTTTAQTTSQKPKTPPAPTIGKNEGLLDINAVPWGLIYVDGKNVGAAPDQRVVVPPGRHTVELYQQGRPVAGKTVDVKPSKSTIVKLIADP